MFRPTVLLINELINKRSICSKSAFVWAVYSNIMALYPGLVSWLVTAEKLGNGLMAQYGCVRCPICQVQGSIKKYWYSKKCSQFCFFWGSTSYFRALCPL